MRIRVAGVAALARVLALLAACIAPHVHAQDAYPNRPVRIVVPTAPGGPSDNSARMIAQELTKRWGRQVIVDIRPGAGTIIGTDMVAKAAPDGYTLLVAPSAIVIVAVSYKKLPFDPLRDFIPVTQTLFVPNLILVHPSLPAKSVKEFIALARSRPGEILYASSGHGTNPHLTVELFTSMAKIKLMHIPYKGTMPGLIDLLAGRSALIATSSMALTVPHVRSGKLRALGITSARRSAALPDMPTIAESGLPNYEAVQWSGLFAPAGTPTDIVGRLHKETVAIVNQADVKERLAADSAEIVGSSQEQFSAFMKSEAAKWAAVAKSAGIQPE